MMCHILIYQILSPAATLKANYSLNTLKCLLTSPIKSETNYLLLSLAALAY